MIRNLSVLFSAATLVLVMGSGALAGPAPSREHVETAREESLRRIHSLLDNQAAREQLAKMGVERQELESKLDRLDDSELQRLADQLESLNVGGDALGVVIALLVIAGLVLLILFLMERV
jgi:hypothetical protein